MDVLTTLGWVVNTIINSVIPNDIVIIEFGHNEGGGPAANPQQGVCPGTSLTATCQESVINEPTNFFLFRFLLSIYLVAPSPDRPCSLSSNTWKTQSTLSRPRVPK